MRKTIQTWLAGVLSVWVLLLTFATASPVLHEVLHWAENDGLCFEKCDADDTGNEGPPVREPEHRCGVTLFASGVSLIASFDSHTSSQRVFEIVELHDFRQTGYSHSITVYARAPPVG